MVMKVDPYDQWSVTDFDDRYVIIQAGFKDSNPTQEWSRYLIWTSSPERSRELWEKYHELQDGPCYMLDYRVNLS